MKRLAIIFGALVVALSSCTKEDLTTYSLYSEDGLFATITDELYSNNYYNVETEIIFSEYGEGHRLSYQTIEDVVDGKEYFLVANPRTEYVTVRIEVTADHSAYGSFEFIRYLGNVIFLEQGENTKITINGSTRVTQTEPK